MCALNIVLFVLLFRNLGIQLNKQDRVQKTLIMQQEELDRLVSERTRQLEALAWHLQSVGENEKTELARELHDELSSILTASKMDVAWVRNKLPDSDPAMAEKFARARQSRSGHCIEAPNHRGHAADRARQFRPGHGAALARR